MTKISTSTLIKLIIIPLIVLFFGQINAQNQRTRNWPKVIPLENLSITIYQPQLEALAGNSLEARAAFNIYDGTKLPVFGAMWVRARVHIDKASRSVIYDEIELIDVNFPDVTEKKKNEFRELLQAVTPTWQFQSNLDDFSTESEALKIDAQASNGLNNNPPNIFFEQTPTELIYIDGEPILEDIDGSTLYQHVVNTPYFIVHSSSDRFYYLKAGIWWYRAKELYDEWLIIGYPPQTIVDLDAKFNTYNPQGNKEILTNSSRKPQLYVVTYPAALIETKGAPEEVPITGTRLMYIDNTDNDLLKDTKTGLYYVRFSGRWYKSKALYRGAWSFVPPDSLPVYFMKIPYNAKLGYTRISMPRTPEAMSAALDNFIPQTAIVDRKTAEMKVEYDGEPIFEAIEGTSLAYAINTNSSVLKTSKNLYYAVDEAIWFTAISPEGPWVVATRTPEDVQKIPPSSPVYNVKYVYIYDASEEYVYVGYTGGYLGSYLYQGCIFYGTGYQYKPWYKSKYIPRPVTYAFGVNRSEGKNSNISISVGVGYGYGGYGYPGFYSPYGYGGYGGYGFGHYSTVNGNYELKKGYESKPLDQVNIYNNRTKGILASINVKRSNPYDILPENQQANDSKHIPPTSLYSDKSGNIYKQGGDGVWMQRVDGVWVKTKVNPRN